MSVGPDRAAILSISYTAIEVLEQLVERSSVLLVRNLMGQLSQEEVLDWFTIVARAGTEAARLRAALPTPDATALEPASTDPTRAYVEQWSREFATLFMASNPDWQPSANQKGV
jgi:hypothetical protein